ncbi:MAG: MBOAT family O-acyltransferase [Bacillota bacterium]
MIQSAAFWLVLALSVPLYWLTPARFRMGFLALVSIGYLSTVAVWSVVLFLGWSLVFFWGLPWMLRVQTRQTAQRAVRVSESLQEGGGTATGTATIGVAELPTRSSIYRWGLPTLMIVFLACFICFRYVLPKMTASARQPAGAIPVMLGISYFTFKLLHYAAEVSRGNIKDRSLPRFLCYVFLFPTFTAGPINRFDHFLANQPGRWEPALLVDGLTRVIHGLIKRFIVAGMLLAPSYEYLVKARTLLPASDMPTTVGLWGLAIQAYLYLYMDFSAYSDIAIGASRLFGLRMPENFDWPILAPNIAVFWKRWHMTLTLWCQSYVYMPVLGLTRSPYLAVYAAFVAIGLWHGATFEWTLWGVYHATGLAIYQVWARARRRWKWRFAESALWKCAGVVATLLFVSAGTIATMATAPTGYEVARVLAKLLFIDLPPR